MSSAGGGDRHPGSQDNPESLMGARAKKMGMEDSDTEAESSTSQEFQPVLEPAEGEMVAERSEGGKGEDEGEGEPPKGAPQEEKLEHPEAEGDVELEPPEAEGEVELEPPEAEGEVELEPPEAEGEVELEPPEAEGNLELQPLEGILVQEAVEAWGAEGPEEIWEAEFPDEIWDLGAPREPWNSTWQYGEGSDVWEAVEAGALVAVATCEAGAVCEAGEAGIAMGAAAWDTPEVWDRGADEEGRVEEPTGETGSEVAAEDNVAEVAGPEAAPDEEGDQSMALVPVGASISGEISSRDQARGNVQQPYGLEIIVDAHEFPTAGFRFMFLDMVETLLHQIYYNNIMVPAHQGLMIVRSRPRNFTLAWPQLPPLGALVESSLEEVVEEDESMALVPVQSTTDPTNELEVAGSGMTMESSTTDPDETTEYQEENANEEVQDTTTEEEKEDDNENQEGSDDNENEEEPDENQEGPDGNQEGPDENLPPADNML